MSATALRRFAHDLAKRFDGSTEGLPRVRYWQAWNEPNLSLYLNPQVADQLTRQPTYPFEPRTVLSPAHYRDLVNAFSAAVHAVAPDNKVIAGALSPFSRTQTVIAVSPLLFMRKLFCLSADGTPAPGCRARVAFDIWAVHPYTSGGPTHRATLPDDLSLGDLGHAQQLLKSAQRAGRIRAAGPVAVWVTELGWDTRPPDPGGVPLGLQARWVAESLYRLWRRGVDLVTWYGLRDEALDGRPPGEVIQTGLYFRGTPLPRDRAKPALAAFRFPFVAFRQKGSVLVWGRTPWGEQGKVTIEALRANTGAGMRWKTVAHVETNRYGIFLHHFARVRATALRATLVGKRDAAERAVLADGAPGDPGEPVRRAAAAMTARSAGRRA